MVNVTMPKYSIPMVQCMMEDSKTSNFTDRLSTRENRRGNKDSFEMEHLYMGISISQMGQCTKDPLKMVIRWVTVSRNSNLETHIKGILSMMSLRGQERWSFRRDQFTRVVSVGESSMERVNMNR